MRQSGAGSDWRRERYQSADENDRIICAISAM